MMISISSSQKISFPLKRFNDYRKVSSTKDTGIISEEDVKRRGLQAYNVTMTNFNNYQYYASLYMGNAQKDMTFIWDTGSTLLWVPLDSCSS